MSTLIRRYKLANGMEQEERIDDETRIERYMKLFDREDVKKIKTGQKIPAAPAAKDDISRLALVSLQRGQLVSSGLVLTDCMSSNLCSQDWH